MSAERESPGPVVALYIDPRGPYPKLLGPENCWDEQRDARLYEGPHPVVAHPPCGPWGAFRHLCTKQDRELAPRAVAQVRAYGGVLEHPVGSRLWGHCRLPMPGAFSDAFGGFSIFVNQVDWGHPCSKPTLLYFVGIPYLTVLNAPYPPEGSPTHDMMGARGRNAAARRGSKREASQEMRRRTPPAFAEWLVELARTARRPQEEG